MPEPVDRELYQQVKTKVYKRIPKHSAYRSGVLVQEYKRDFKKLHGNRPPYRGKKQTKKTGLGRWFAEKWRNQRGTVGYSFKSDVYRPTKRITSKTPTTFRELTKKQLRRARREKTRKNRVKKFAV
jgi:hypothetical protein